MTTYLYDPGGTDAFLREVLDQRLEEIRGESSDRQYVQLVDPAALQQRMAEEAYNAEKRSAMALLLRLAEPKLLVYPKPEHLAAIRQLAETMPNSQYFLQRVECRLRTQLLGRRPLNLGCQLLVGAPGNGKSYALRKVGEALGLPTVEIALGGTADTLAIHGSSRQWGSASPGRIAMALAQSEAANPLFLLDEVDKTAKFSGHGSVENVLLGLLEPENSRAFSDKFLAVPVNASFASYLCTANSSEALTEPLLSRLEVVTIEPPEPSQWPALANHLYGLALSEQGLTEVFTPCIPIDLLPQLLADCDSIRDLRRRIRTAIEAAVLQLPEDALLAASNLAPAPTDTRKDARKSSRRIGFL